MSTTSPLGPPRHATHRMSPDATRRLEDAGALAMIASFLVFLWLFAVVFA